MRKLLAIISCIPNGMTRNNRSSQQMEKPHIINLTRILDHRGNLSVVEQFRDFPFEIKRVYWVYDVPGGESRGGHSHKQQTELLVAVGGSFSVSTDDGETKESFFLNHPYRGLLLPKGVWRTLDDFSSGAVCLVLASDYFDEEDYIRDYNEFLDTKGKI